MFVVLAIGFEAAVLILSAYYGLKAVIY